VSENNIETYIQVSAWAMDFWYAFLDRPKFLRWIAKIAMGKYAYRELYEIKVCFENVDLLPNIGYSLKHMDYHKDKVDLG